MDFLSTYILTLICVKWVPEDPSTIFLATSFTLKIPESSDSKHSSISMLENIWCHHFTSSVPNSQEIVNLFQFSSDLWGPTNEKKLTISCEFGPLLVKWWYHMFSSIKKEEYIGFELSGIFWVKVVAKNIVLGSLGTQHQAFFAVWCHFLKKHANFLNQTVTLKSFPC